MTGQAALDLDFAAGTCNYGTPQPGEARQCSKPATHAAVCQQHPYSCGAGACNHPIGMRLFSTGFMARVECCRDHANYYASQWAYVSMMYPESCRSRHEATWIEILGGPDA